MKGIVWPRFSHGAVMVFRRDFLAWVKYYKSSLLLNFGEPLTNLLALGFGLGMYVAKMDGVPFVDFIGPGLLAVTAMNAVTFDTTFGAYDRLNVNGVYESMVTTPLSAGEIVAGEFLWEACRSLLYGTVFFIVLLALGLVHSWWSLLLPLPLLITGALFSAPALFVATKAKNNEQLFYYFSLVITPMFMFSGVFFPLSKLPVLIRDLILITPLVHVVDIVRALILGHPTDSLWVDAAVVVAYTVGLSILPATALKKRLTG
ncbi:MAG: ABC transporter permease [Firmicutes bacterium]|jgi:lipooligosaccharide transport system permease protein|nr:ABC transporter permease [Bacillota bacterium]